jgi:hypothetical protein
LGIDGIIEVGLGAVETQSREGEAKCRVGGIEDGLRGR